MPAVSGAVCHLCGQRFSSAGHTAHCPGPGSGLRLADHSSSVDPSLGRDGVWAGLRLQCILQSEHTLQSSGCERQLAAQTRFGRRMTPPDFFFNCGRHLGLCRCAATTPSLSGGLPTVRCGRLVNWGEESTGQ